MKKEVTNNGLSMLKGLFENMANGYDKDASEAKNTENFKNDINESLNSVKNTESETKKNVISLFKEMLKDEDNKLMIIVNNRFINFEKEIKVASYSKLPESIQSLVNENKLHY